MASKNSSSDIDRRNFLKSVATTGALAGLLPAAATARTSRPEADTKPASPPGENRRSREQDPPKGYTAAEADRYFVANAGSDYMVDVIKSLNVEYMAINPGDTFRGLHESIVNYGGNKMPEIITCLHEEQAAAMAHGYFKVSGRPLLVACHGTVGFQHVAMGVYNAWADRVPMIVIGGNDLDATRRGSMVGWAHTAQDPVKVIRDYVKWDDQPVSLQQFGESLVRAYKIAMTPPMGPVAIIAETFLQEDEIKGRPVVPRYASSRPPQGDANAVKAVAKMLVDAEAPVIVVNRCAHSQEGVDLLVELAELLQAPVVDRGGRMNFPNTHYLNQSYRETVLVSQADVILGLELNDAYGLFYGKTRNDGRVITINSRDLFLKSNYQDFQRYYSADISIAADAQATLPALNEAVREAMSHQRRSQIARRRHALKQSYATMRNQLLDAARYAWNASPVSVARLCMEVWEQIKDHDWALTSPTIFKNYWPQKLWSMDKHYQYIGNQGAYGIGYGAPASAGAALAHRASGRLPVNIQSDGDLMYGPGCLWTAAHHNIPLLSVMHNNGGYHQEFMQFQTMANRRQRGVTAEHVRIGNEINHPLIDFAGLAKSLGVWSSGPISDPADLAHVLKKAVDVVKNGEPALVDVICQPR